MAKFRFRMQNYLALKMKIEDQKQLDYGLALKALEEARQLKEQMEQEKDKSLRAFRTQISLSVKPDMFQNYNNYIEWMKKRIKAQQKEIERAQAAAESKRLALVEAMRERKTLEKLKERNYEEYQKDENLAEQKIVDEIVSYRYNNQEQ